MVIKLFAALVSAITQKLHSPHTSQSTLSGWAKGEEACCVTNPYEDREGCHLGDFFLRLLVADPPYSSSGSQHQDPK